MRARPGRRADREATVQIASKILKDPVLWGVFVALLVLLGPKQGRELDIVVMVLAAIGAVAWRIWKEWR